MACSLFCRLNPLDLSGVRMPLRRNFSPIAGSFVLVLGLMLVAAVPGWVWADGHGSIGGIVRSGEQVVGAHRIMLIRFGPDNDVQRTPGETDAQGAFLFDNLSTEAGFTYFVGIRYEEQLHRSEPISLQDPPNRTDIVLNLDDPSAQALPAQPAAPALRVTSHLMVVVKRNDRLEVREIVKILNRGRAAFSGSSDAKPGPHGSFGLALPLGYYDLQGIEGDLDSSHVHQHATGLVYTAPLEPGEHNLMFTYALPMPGKVMMILPRRTLPTDALDILVEEQSFAATSDLEFAGRVSIEPHVFTHFRGAQVCPSGRVPGSSLLRERRRFRRCEWGFTASWLPCRWQAWRRHTVRTRYTPGLLYCRRRRSRRFNRFRNYGRQSCCCCNASHGLTGNTKPAPLADADYYPRRGDYKAQFCSILRQLQRAGELSRPNVSSGPQGAVEQRPLMVHLDRVTKRFGASSALQGINLQLESGKCLGARWPQRSRQDHLAENTFHPYGTLKRHGDHRGPGRVARCGTHTAAPGRVKPPHISLRPPDGV